MEHVLRDAIDTSGDIGTRARARTLGDSATWGPCESLPAPLDGKMEGGGDSGDDRPPAPEPGPGCVRGPGLAGTTAVLAAALALNALLAARGLPLLFCRKPDRCARDDRKPSSPGPHPT